VIVCPTVVSAGETAMVVLVECLACPQLVAALAASTDTTQQRKRDRRTTFLLTM